MSPARRSIPLLLALLSFAGACDQPPEMVAASGGAGRLRPGRIQRQLAVGGPRRQLRRRRCRGPRRRERRRRGRRGQLRLPGGAHRLFLRAQRPVHERRGGRDATADSGGLHRAAAAARPRSQAAARAHLPRLVRQRDRRIQDWVARFPTEIYTFVDAANVLIEMSQADRRKSGRRSCPARSRRAAPTSTSARWWRWTRSIRCWPRCRWTRLATSRGRRRASAGRPSARRAASACCWPPTRTPPARR